MKIYVTLLILVLFASPARSQQHALTVDQCRADVTAWVPDDVIHALRASDSLPPNIWSDFNAGINYEELVLRMEELTQCQKVEANAPFRLGPAFDISRYRDSLTIYTLSAGERMSNFLVRNHMWERFLEEDKQGKR